MFIKFKMIKFKYRINYESSVQTSITDSPILAHMWDVSVVYKRCYRPSFLTRGPLAWETSCYTQTYSKAVLIRAGLLKFVLISRWEMAWPFSWTILKSPSPRHALCQVYLHWPTGSGEDFYMSSVYFRHYRHTPMETNMGLHWIPFTYNTQGCFVLSLVEIDPVVLEKMKLKRLKTDGWRTSDKKSSLEFGKKLPWVELRIQFYSDEISPREDTISAK